VRDRFLARLERGAGPLDKEAMLAGEMTPAAARILDHARAEAAHFGCETISTPYLLLGMLWEPDSISAQVLTEYGADLEMVRSIVAENPHE
jgi:ATP-dependent Clp protease ATP-binding subunit ClpC